MNDQQDGKTGFEDLDSLQDISGESLHSIFDESESAPSTPEATVRRKADISVFRRIPVQLTLEVDSVEIMLGELLDLNPGEVLPLDKKLGEPLDVKVNGQLLARAEVVVVEGRYGLRLIDIVDNVRLPGAAQES